MTAFYRFIYLVVLAYARRKAASIDRSALGFFLSRGIDAEMAAELETL